MKTVTLEIPPQISQALRLPRTEVESRLRLELAVALYAQELLGLGKAAEFAGLSRLSFEDELARRHLPMHYDETDWTQDLTYARSGK